LARHSTTDQIRNVSVADPEWNAWLADFPYPPPLDEYWFNRFVRNIQLHLARTPDKNRLSPDEQYVIALLLNDYSYRLVRKEKDSVGNSVVEGAMLFASGVGAWLDIALMTPISLIMSAGLLVKNRADAWRWRNRKMILEEISDWIRELVR
tara:strand:+ start:52 stop:504 length:453 start_codon:yes stop_codon:yes gene_type:complete